jgi:hypothetical protein
MKNPKVTYRTAFLAALLLVCLIATQLVSWAGPVYGQGKMYEEFDGLVVFYKPTAVDTYRKLLPDLFDMPDQSLVQVFIIDYYKMASWAIKPYLEAAVFLLAKYKGETVWHCVTMPVTTDEARIGGITYLGYPKVMADVTLDRSTPAYSGIVKAEGKTIMELTLHTASHVVTSQEKEWFDRLTGVGSLNILRGQVIDPLPGTRKQKDSLYELSLMYPAMFTVKIGRAKLTLTPQATPKDEDWRPSAFSIQPAEIVLAYYFKNKYGFSFGQPRSCPNSRHTAQHPLSLVFDIRSTYSAHHGFLA